MRGISIFGLVAQLRATLEFSDDAVARKVELIAEAGATIHILATTLGCGGAAPAAAAAAAAAAGDNNNNSSSSSTDAAGVGEAGAGPAQKGGARLQRYVVVAPKLILRKDSSLKSDPVGVLRAGEVVHVQDAVKVRLPACLLYKSSCPSPACSLPACLL